MDGLWELEVGREGRDWGVGLNWIGEAISLVILRDGIGVEEGAGHWGGLCRRTGG